MKRKKTEISRAQVVAWGVKGCKGIYFNYIYLLETIAHNLTSKGGEECSEVRVLANGSDM